MPATLRRTSWRSPRCWRWSRRRTGSPRRGGPCWLRLCRRRGDRVLQRRPVLLREAGRPLHRAGPDRHRRSGSKLAAQHKRERRSAHLPEMVRRRRLHPRCRGADLRLASAGVGLLQLFSQRPADRAVPSARPEGRLDPVPLPGGGADPRRQRRSTGSAVSGLPWPEVLHTLAMPMAETRYSLIIPVYRNEETLDALLAALRPLAAELEHKLEVVFVVDGSPDRSHLILQD